MPHGGKVAPASLRPSRGHFALARDPQAAVEEIPIRQHNLCFLGFGNVNRTLVQLLADRELELRDRYGIAFRITGIA